jgi:hypothetical protein
MVNTNSGGRSNKKNDIKSQGKVVEHIHVRINICIGDFGRLGGLAASFAFSALVTAWSLKAAVGRSKDFIASSCVRVAPDVNLPRCTGASRFCFWLARFESKNLVESLAASTAGGFRGFCGLTRGLRVVEGTVRAARTPNE